MSEENSVSLTSVDQPVGVQMTLKRETKVNYQTCNGTKVFDKILTGFKPILFPTAVSRNSCFEYRFSIKDLILPAELPKVTDLYFKDLVVKIQDMFTEITAHGAIHDNLIIAYQPYTAVLSQDENGIETEEHIINGEKHKFVSSDRVIKRDSSPIFVVSSNLKFEKSFNQEVVSNSYKALAIYNVYDENGKFNRKFVKSIVSINPEDLRDIISSKWDDENDRKGRAVCIDIILCDVLIFCLRSFNIGGKSYEEIESSDLQKVKDNLTLPNGWLTPEEKLDKFGKKGTFMSTFNNDSEIPNSLFQYVDMQSKCNKLCRIGYPSEISFNDKKHIIADFDAYYAQTYSIVSLRILSDQ